MSSDWSAVVAPAAGLSGAMIGFGGNWLRDIASGKRAARIEQREYAGTLVSCLRDLQASLLEQPANAETGLVFRFEQRLVAAIADATIPIADARVRNALSGALGAANAAKHLDEQQMIKSGAAYEFQLRMLNEMRHVAGALRRGEKPAEQNVAALERAAADLDSAISSLFER